MKQAFVIMQIGNPELDLIYKDVVIPAAAINGLEAKRVDKHNSGNLLKSEITGFIKKADIIIADLTNARPNCYLEVGYAMGLDKYSNLILTSREDHNPDSPNHIASGPKVHFDLAGYDILWWKPNEIETFKTELDKRIKRRLKTVTISHNGSNNAIFNEDWLKKLQNEGFSGFQNNGKAPYMEIKIALKDLQISVDQTELVRISEKIQEPYIGWPIALVAGNIVTPTMEGIKSRIVFKQHYDFWGLNCDGTFYLLRQLWEFKSGQQVVMYDLRIKQVTELLLYCARLYHALGAKEDDEIAITIKYGGLMGYLLRKSPADSIEAQLQTEMAFLGHEKECREQEVTIPIIITIRDIQTSLVETVERLTKPLFLMFQFYEVPKDTLTQIVEATKESLKSKH
jgi:hypothetical protein